MDKVINQAITVRMVIIALKRLEFPVTLEQETRLESLRLLDVYQPNRQH